MLLTEQSNLTISTMTFSLFNNFSNGIVYSISPITDINTVYILSMYTTLQNMTCIFSSTTQRSLLQRMQRRSILNQYIFVIVCITCYTIPSCICLDIQHYSLLVSKNTSNYNTNPSFYKLVHILYHRFRASLWILQFPIYLIYLL